MTALPAFAQIPATLTGDISPRTLRIQEQVEKLVTQGEELAARGDHQRAYFNFKRAHAIYKNDLAPVGDKYAQYMVGYMYLTGTGVDEDQVLASAWYRLAAESSYPELLAVRNLVLESLTDVDRIRSDQYFLQLRSKYSDVVLLLNLIKEEKRYIRARTGSRISGGASPVTIVNPRSGRSVSGDEYVRRIKSRIKTYLDLMEKHVDLDDFERDYSDLDTDHLERIVDAYVQNVTDY